MAEEQGHTSIGAALRARALEAVRFHPREVVALVALAVAVLGGAVLAYARARPAPAAALAPVASPSAEPQKQDELVVHVVGAVQKPGVYRFREGARVLDAVRAAGGFTSKADKSVINLARLLVDGEQVVVPRKGEVSAPTASSGGGSAAPGGKVNINTATVSDLDTLPGIGPVLAQRIFDYREQHGPFRDVKDLLKVPGIGPRTFDSLETLVTV